MLGKLPRATFDAVYAAGPRRGPRRHVQPDGRGHTGRWGVPGHRAVVVRQRLSARRPCSSPTASWTTAASRRLRMMVLAPEDVEIKDTWSVSGLCGTGSHDFVANDVFVPGERQLRPLGRALPRPPAAPAARAVRCPPCRSAAVGRRHRRGRAGGGDRPGPGQGADVQRGRRWPPIRCSSTSWPTPTPACGPPAPCSTPTPKRHGPRRRGAPRSASRTGPASGPRPPG